MGNYLIQIMFDLIKEADSISSNSEAERWSNETINFAKQYYGIETANEFKSDSNIDSFITLRRHKGRLKALIAKEETEKEKMLLNNQTRADFNLKKEDANAKITPIEKAKIFIVHGHDNAIKESIARFVERHELEAVILHEQPNQGKTIIEKFEEFSNVHYAIILLTPDDVGASVNNKDKLLYRARQNVIFELGFFIGKLGRKRVCALYKDKIEIPSDYNGIIYVPYDDAGAWKLKISKELIEIGLTIDMNNLK
jgi:predicted nucleotide-binding protein